VPSNDRAGAASLRRLERKPLAIDIDDAGGPGGDRLGDMDYETFLAAGDPYFPEMTPQDEWEAIALNYTSGTTGNLRVSSISLSPPRRLSECARQHPRLGHAASSGLSVDLADVPLQRLVLSVDRHCARGNACVPAAGRGRGNL
jgi:hypothetical protein